MYSLIGIIHQFSIILKLFCQQLVVTMYMLEIMYLKCNDKTILSALILAFHAIRSDLKMQLN